MKGTLCFLCKTQEGSWKDPRWAQLVSREEVFLCRAKDIMVDARATHVRNHAHVQNVFAYMLYTWWRNTHLYCDRYVKAYRRPFEPEQSQQQSHAENSAGSCGNLCTARKTFEVFSQKEHLGNFLCVLHFLMMLLLIWSLTCSNSFLTLSYILLGIS